MTNEKGETFFVGKDVAEALGYANTLKAIRDHVDDEDKGVNEMFTPGGNQKVVIINESGLYSLVLSSKLPQACTQKVPCVRCSDAATQLHSYIANLELWHKSIYRYKKGNRLGSL